MTIDRLVWLTRIFTILLTWIVFGILWWAPLIFLESYAAFGAVFPIPTEWVFEAARSGAPLVAALLYSVVFLWLFLRPGPYTSWIIAAMLGFAALLASTALAAIAIPLMQCGFHWPDLPWANVATRVTAVCELTD